MPLHGSTLHEWVLSSTLRISGGVAGEDREAVVDVSWHFWPVSRCRRCRKSRFSPDPAPNCGDGIAKVRLDFRAAEPTDWPWYAASGKWRVPLSTVGASLPIRHHAGVPAGRADAGREPAGEHPRLLDASPFHGEGHRRVWARLRLAGLRTSRHRARHATAC